MTRIQKERFSDVREYERVKGVFVLTPKILKAASAAIDENNHVFSSGLRTLIMNDKYHIYNYRKTETKDTNCDASFTTIGRGLLDFYI